MRTLPLVCALAALAASLAWAQSATTPAASKTTADTVTSGVASLGSADTVIVPVWPKAAVALPDTQEAIATSFTLGAVEGVDPKLISGVTANGYARKVAVENQAIGQVLVVSVAKGAREESISTEGLTAQFDAAKTSQLFPEKSLTVEGSKAALVAALEKLNVAAKTEAAKKEVKDEASENAVSGSAGGNELASGYTTPSITAATPAADEPEITVSSTTSGCAVRIDLTQEKAFVQSKEQTFSNGVLSSESACSDSEVSYPLKKSHLACPDVVDLTALTAWPQYTLYYVDGAAENHTVSECTQDTGTPYTIAEDEGACGIFLDFTAAQAVPQSALVYTNRSGTKVQARGCDTSTLSAAIPMTESTAACSLRHDFAAGLSHELSTWTYARDGVTYQASSCSDTGRTFVHETVYADTAGEYVCAPVVNLAANTVTLQSRKRITLDGAAQFITECAPDTASQAIAATTEGCMNPALWTHDLDAGVSYGQERFYYLKGGATPVYVTACQTSATTYTQDQAISGYQYHDAQLHAFALMTVTISVNGTPYTIKSSEVLPGAPQLAYVLGGTVDKKDGSATYEGCNAWYTTTRIEQWQRPDATIFEKAIGAGTPAGPTNVCVNEFVESRLINPTGDGYYTVASWCSGGQDNGDVPCNKYQGVIYSAHMNKYQNKNKETGQTVNTACSWQTTWNAISSDSAVYTYYSQWASAAQAGSAAYQSVYPSPCPF